MHRYLVKGARIGQIEQPEGGEGGKLLELSRAALSNVVIVNHMCLWSAIMQIVRIEIPYNCRIHTEF